MKTRPATRIISLLVLSFALISTGHAENREPYSISPPEKAGKKWRIGYYEGGPYKNYPVTLISTVKSLADFGWIPPIHIPKARDENDIFELWTWLSRNVESPYIEFAADACYSNGWNKDTREGTRQAVIRRLNQARDIDLMIAMGTHAGQDLANGEHAAPTVVCSVSDAVASGIIPSLEDSGYDHVHALVDPSRYVRQIRSFYDIIRFKKVGVSYQDTIPGRSYAAVKDLLRIGGKAGFETLECPLPDIPHRPEFQEMAVECARTLAPRIDAFYLTIQPNLKEETIGRIIAVMNEAGIPVFSQFGAEEVKMGALMSVARTEDMLIYGKCHAATIARILNGARPRDLGQVCEAKARLAFNKMTARKIGLNPRTFQLLLRTAHEIHDE